MKTKYNLRNGTLVVLVLFLIFMSAELPDTIASNSQPVKQSDSKSGKRILQSRNFKIVAAAEESSPFGEAKSPNYAISTVTFKLHHSVLNKAGELIPPPLPTEFKLLQNYPNPFNPETTIEYHLPQTSLVKLTIYDVQGHRVCQLTQTEQVAGIYKVRWDGHNDTALPVASGMYFCRIEVQTQAGKIKSFSQVKKMILMK